MTLSSLIRPSGPALALLLALSACSTTDLSTADSVDYRSASKNSAPLDVPPDLTQLSRDTRYKPQGGVVSATAFQASASAPPAAPATTTATVAGPAVPASGPPAGGDIRVVREGNERWLATPMAPEQLWPQLRAFWQERGLTLVVDQPETGVMETDWAENRAKLPQDMIRASLGKVFDSLYSTGERDKFRTRVERTPTGSDVFITAKGMVEVYTDAQKTQTVWQPRPVDSHVEAEMLTRLQQKLTGKPPQPAAMVAAAAPGAAAPAASAPAPAPRARLVTGGAAAALQVDDGFDRAWRRVGLALDRSGFTVEDRDRAQGIYFVRYVDPKQAGKDEPSAFAKLFSFGSKDDKIGPVRYRVSVKADGPVSNVTVQNGQGAPENGEAGQRIVQLLLNDLK